MNGLAPAPSPAVLLKLAHDDADVMITARMAAMRDEIQAAEDARSKHRNGNRLMVLAVAFMINSLWPALVLHVLHLPVADASWTPAMSSGADILVTAYALMRRY